MILNVVSAKYINEYSLLLEFSNGRKKIVDLGETISKEKREVFFPLLEVDFFKNFSIPLNTVEWANGVDFSPEYLYEIGQDIT
ncbi:MAG: DUF2442 domain-containing protein [Bacteroidetes bacterium]|nr:DUF2442 domain-containing protein [Bacteroidota bacterium]MBU1719400.1 DUF2442 domain-containing protein [Bacteroidota bacterium]